jgi:AAA family ATP:ADP antiporter
MSTLSHRSIRIRPDELRSTVLAALLFFLLLCSYYVLRPVRDEMAVRLGTQQLKWLFTATFLAMLAATPVFGWLASVLRRAILVPATLGFFALNLLAFRAALDAPDLATGAAIAFFVWVSVFNLFVVSVFWSLITDLFDLEQAERLFGLVSVGGTAGAIAGPALTAALVTRTGVPDLLLLSAALLGAALPLAVALARARGGPAGHNRASRGGAALGGSAWEGFALVWRSPGLRWFCLFLCLHSFVGTVLYFEQTRIVGAMFPSPEARTALFAQVDLAVNTLTLLTQLLGLAPLLHRFGLSVALALLPAASVVGLLALGLWPTLGMLVGFGIVRRAGEYAIARPAREMLFTVLPRAARYKAKNFLDTAVFRGADATSGWLTDGLRATGLAGGALALAALPAALAGAVIGWRLGRSSAIMSAEHGKTSDEPSPDLGEPPTLAARDGRRDPGARHR